MNTSPILLLITMSAILMVKCTGRNLLVDIDDANESSKFFQFYLYPKFLHTIDYNDSKLKIIKFCNTSGQENCLAEGLAFCDAQSPCCAGLSCVVKELKELITHCVPKDNSGKYNFFEITFITY